MLQNLLSAAVVIGALRVVFFITSLWEQMTPEHGQFRPKGHDWQDLCMGQLDIAKYRSCGSYGLRDDLLKFFPIQGSYRQDGVKFKDFSKLSYCFQGLKTYEKY